MTFSDPKLEFKVMILLNVKYLENGARYRAISHFQQLYGCISSRLRYSASKNRVTLKTGSGVVQGHQIWCSSTYYWSAIVL